MNINEALAKIYEEFKPQNAQQAEAYNKLVSEFSNTADKYANIKIRKTPVGISSTDHIEQFKNDSERLDDILGTRRVIGGAFEDKDIIQQRNKYTYNNATDENDIESFDEFYKKNGFDTLVKSLEKKLDAERNKIEKMYQTELALIDRETNNTIERIKSLYDARIEETKRLYRQRIDAMKAYGLASGMMMNASLMMKDAISLREEEFARELQKLNAERDRLITEAQNARMRGRSDVLKQKLDDIYKLDDRIRDQLRAIEDEARKRYELMLKEKEKEQEMYRQQIEDAKKLIAASSYKYVDDFMKAKTEEERDKIVQKMLGELGINGTIFVPIAYSSIYDLAYKKNKDSALTEYEKKIKEKELEYKKAQAAKAWNDAEKSRLDIELKKKKLKESNNADKDNKPNDDIANIFNTTKTEAADDGTSWVRLWIDTNEDAKPEKDPLGLF